MLYTWHKYAKSVLIRHLFWDSLKMFNDRMPRCGSVREQVLNRLRAIDSEWQEYRLCKWIACSFDDDNYWHCFFFVLFLQVAPYMLLESGWPPLRWSIFFLSLLILSLTVVAFVFSIYFFLSVDLWWKTPASTIFTLSLLISIFRFLFVCDTTYRRAFCCCVYLCWRDKKRMKHMKIGNKTYTNNTTTDSLSCLTLIKQFIWNRREQTYKRNV